MTHKTSEHPLLYTVPEAALALRVGRSTVYRLVEAGELPTVHIGRAVRIPATALARYVEARTAGGDTPQLDTSSATELARAPIRGRAA